MEVYTVTVTGANGCTRQATTSVTVNNSPNPSAGSNSPVCQGSTINLTSSGAGLFGSYSWTGPNGFTSNSQNPSISNATASHAGTYTVTATNLSGCSAQATVNVIVNPSPTATAGSNAPSLCWIYIKFNCKWRFKLQLDRT
ncbi:MAG: immunoglobulin domain-containing protein [Crocinitomicaceae bacterium]